MDDKTPVFPPQKAEQLLKELLDKVGAAYEKTNITPNGRTIINLNAEQVKALYLIIRTYYKIRNEKLKKEKKQ